MDTRGPIWGPFRHQIKSKFRSLAIFSNSFHLFHISIASHAYSKWSEMCGELGPQKFNFWANLGHKISKNSSLWSFSQNNSTGFASVWVYMSIWATFRSVLNIDVRGRISGSFIFYMLIGVCLGVFQCVFPLAAELVRSTGLLFKIYVTGKATFARMQSRNDITLFIFINTASQWQVAFLPIHFIFMPVGRTRVRENVGHINKNLRVVTESPN